MTTCKKHNIELSVLNQEYLNYEYCPICAEENDKLEDQRVAAQKESESIARERRCIMPRYYGASIADISEHRVITGWANEPSGFIFVYGACGCGKTHVASAIQREWNIRKVPSSLFYTADIFLQIRSSFSRLDGPTEIELVEQFAPYSHSHPAIFDDIGAQKMSEHVVQTWYSIIDRRYMQNQPTMFTSNLTLKEISIYMTDRVASRLASGIVYEIKDGDRRLKTHPSERKQG